MLKLNNIYNMDCVEGLKLIDDNTVDLVVTSPPYNLDIKYDSYKDCLPIDDYLDWCDKWIHEISRVLKNSGRVCINHCISEQVLLEQDKSKYGRCWFPLVKIGELLEKNNLHIFNLAIWDDATVNKFTAWGSWLSASSPFINQPLEGILIAYKGEWKRECPGESTIDKETFMECSTGVWKLGTTPGNTIACFPEKLPYMCIQFLSYKNDVVLDPFSGSGTTCFVAKNLDRKFIGFELSKNYYESSIARLNGVDFKVNTKRESEEVNDVKCNLW